MSNFILGALAMWLIGGVIATICFIVCAIIYKKGDRLKRAWSIPFLSVLSLVGGWIFTTDSVKAMFEDIEDYNDSKRPSIANP